MSPDFSPKSSTAEPTTHILLYFDGWIILEFHILSHLSCISGLWDKTVFGWTDIWEHDGGMDNAIKEDNKAIVSNKAENKVWNYTRPYINERD